MPLHSDNRKKAYIPAKPNKLTPDQAKLVLIGHAIYGHQGAKDLLSLFYPSPEPQGDRDVRANFEDEGNAPTTTMISRLVRRVLAAFQSTREDFRRFGGG
jgi:hypothetical protein